MRLHHTPALIPASILLSLLALSVPAQQPASVKNQTGHDPNAMDSTTTEAQSDAPRMTPEQLALIDRYLTNVRAQPAGKIDTKNAAAGQGITLQVTQDATLANGTRLEKGTKLTGRILRSQAWQKDSAAAVLSIGIDRAILKDGSTVPIHCIIRTLTPAPGLKASMSDASQGGRPSRGSRGGGLPPMGGSIGADIPLGGPMGGGGMGADTAGLGGANSPGGAPGNGSIYNNPNSTSTGNGRSSTGNNTPIGTGDPGLGGSSTTIGDRTRNALGTTTAVASADPEQPVTEAGVDLHDAPRRTGLPGVMLSGKQVAGISGTLSAFESNITLDSSTELTLGVITR